LVEDPVVVIDGGKVLRTEGVPASAAEAGTRETPPPPETGVLVGPMTDPADVDEVIDVDGFLMPGVVDRHVHIGFAEPSALLANGVTAVRDLGWPPEDVFPMADASESPSFNGPLIRAVGPMLTCPGGYPTRAAWAPAGTGLEVR